MNVAEVMKKIQHAEAIKDELAEKNVITPTDEDIIEILDEYADILSRMKVIGV